MADTVTNLLFCSIQGCIIRLDTLDAPQHVGKDDLYSNPNMTSQRILKNNKCCGSLNINQLKVWKLELELHLLVSNLLA